MNGAKEDVKKQNKETNINVQIVQFKWNFSTNWTSKLNAI
jgi:hypothetical protein